MSYQTHLPGNVPDLMLKNEALELHAEILEFDLHGILDLSQHIWTEKGRSISSAWDEHATPDKFPLILRHVTSKMSSPIDLDSSVLQQYVGRGLSVETFESRKVYSFSTLAVDVKHATANNPLLLIYVKPLGKLKRKLLLSINFLDPLGELVLAEVRFINFKLKRCGQNAELAGMLWTIRMDPKQQMLIFSLKYQVNLKVLLYRYFSSDVVTVLDELIHPVMTALPLEEDSSFAKFEKLQKDLHLFYKVIAEHTGTLPIPNSSLMHPYISAKLYPFQRRTVNWLLQSEHVQYDENTRTCVDVPLVSDAALALLQSFPDCDNGLLDLEISKILRKICFGWNRVLIKNAVCWYNNYTGNVMSEQQMIEALINLAQELNNSEFGGSGYLCEEMGLGKTVEIISLILLHQRPESAVGQSHTLKVHGESDIRIVKKANTTLIAAPESIIGQWYSEISQMCPHLLVTIYKGINQYPELRNIPKYIAEFLQRYDIVLMNYSVMARELDFAVYSSQRASTRESRKRREFEANNNENRNHARDEISTYQAHFEPLVTRESEEVTYNKKKFDRANLEELGAKARKEYPGDIPHTHFYDSPLIMCEWWRVVLDEIQMIAAGATRAFRTASMIPRIHSWGVSGTPARLASALEFLRVAPFNYETSNFCWKLFENSERNRDFVMLWQLVALRHTKAMVHKDIKLPPQERVLLSLPFTEVEQDTYDSFLTSALASIGLHKNEIPKDCQLSSSECLHLRHWLLRLLQVCANTQIGKLHSRMTSRSKNKAKLLFSNTSELKTLDSVLEDMIKSVLDEVLETEKTIVTKTLDICQVLENALYPETVVEILNFLLKDIIFYLTRVQCSIQSAQTKMRALEKELSSIKFLKQKEFEHSSDSEISDSDDGNVRTADEPAAKVLKNNNQKSFSKSTKTPQDEAGENSTEFDKKEYASKYSKYRKTKDLLHVLRIRLRSWKIIEHKCFFLLASAHFQLYDKEYQAKIKSYRVHVNLAKYTPAQLFQYSLLSQRSQSSEVNYLEGFVKNESRTDTEIELEKHKYLEGVFYSRAEQGRSEILGQPLKDFKAILAKKLMKSKASDPKMMINDGQSLFTKTSRQLLLAIPSFEVSDLRDLAWCASIKDIVDQYISITTKFNAQADFLNECVLSLKDLLASPLLPIEETPDGEEYEQSIENQDKGACLLVTISQLLRDRENAYFEEHARTLVIRKRQDEEFSAEAHQITNKKYLNLLQKKRANLNPKSDSSIEEILKFFRIVEMEWSQAIDFMDVLDAIAKRIRNSAENEKSCQKILRRELNVTFNPIFNSRVEFFKQLQQISDTVQNKAHLTDQENLDGEKISERLDFQFGTLTSFNNKLLRLLSRQKYLERLVKQDKRLKTEEGVDEKEQDDEIICLICQSEIKLGSLTPCGHLFCKICLNEWLSRHPNCPMCKSYTDREVLYNFSIYKPDIRAEKIVNMNVDAVAENKDDETHLVYKHINPTTLKKIQNIQLENSYGSKVDLIVKQVLYVTSVDPDAQIVIFSQWVDLLLILACAFDQAKISYVTAKNPLLSKKKDHLNPAVQFKKKENGITCFLLNSQIQASGLTLVNATHIFLCEPLVNTPTELQAISRIHRIGQTKLTTVWMFAVQNTVEENIVALGTKKRIEYLRSNASEALISATGLGLPNASKEVRLENDNLLTAESESLSYGPGDAKFQLDNESVEYNDIRFLYFGDRAKCKKDSAS